MSAPHFTDRQPDETLAAYIGRLYDSITENGWRMFDAKMAECAAANVPPLPMIELLWSVRQIELSEASALTRPEDNAL